MTMSQTMSVPHALALATQFAARNQTAEATSLYRTILASLPNERSALLGLARLEIAGGQAAAWIERLAALPADVESKRLLGDALWAVGRLDEALACYRGLPTLRPGDGNALAQRYLDTMERVLTGFIYEDPPQDNWGPMTFSAARREAGRDWPSSAHTMIGRLRLHNLRQLTEKVLIDRIPGDFIETGVWRGGACIMLRAILAAYDVRDRRVFVADSFEGLPKPDAEKYPADAGDTHHTHQELAISMEEVRQNFGRYGLLDDLVVFLKGWFKDTLPVAPIDRLAILRLDGDMYESTMDALGNLYPKLSPGGFCIVDDGNIQNCVRAISDYRRTHGIDEPMVDIDGFGFFWRRRAS